MKTVTIPTCANPFVVIVNGIKYTYPAGATMEVPDDVAEVIEQHEEAKTEPAPVQPPYSGDDILAAANAYTDKKVAEGGGGGGFTLPVVELETVPTEEGAKMSPSDNAKLTAAIGKPAIISFGAGGNTATWVCSYYGEGPFHVFACSIGILTIAFQTMDGETWMGTQSE